MAIEYLRVSSGEALLYREHEAEGLTRPGWWYRFHDGDGVWRGPYTDREQAVRIAEATRATSFYAGKAFERQVARDARGDE